MNGIYFISFAGNLDCGKKPELLVETHRNVARISKLHVRTAPHANITCFSLGVRQHSNPKHAVPIIYYMLLFSYSIQLKRCQCKNIYEFMYQKSNNS